MPAATFMGIDVQSARACPYVILNSSAQQVASGWLVVDEELPIKVARVCSNYNCQSVGIDGPRMALPEPRKWYWSNGAWRARGRQAGSGRHCEIVLKSLGIANPQWTPVQGSAPDWMENGFKLFEAFRGISDTYEVFPTASYSMLEYVDEVKVSLSFNGFRRGPKDMLDAAVGAVTVLEFTEGRGCEVGGGDGFGTIILPRPLVDAESGVLVWPSGSDA